MRARQKRKVTASPEIAFSMPFEVNIPAAASSKASAINVARLRAPRGRPAGLPDTPFCHRPSASRIAFSSRFSCSASPSG
jgi:hypothetical protein